jgi:hypothetical protein
MPKVVSNDQRKEKKDRFCFLFVLLDFLLAASSPRCFFTFICGVFVVTEKLVRWRNHFK